MWKITQLLDVLSDREFPNSADIVIAYAARISGGTLKAGDDAGQAAFFPRADLPPIAFRVARQGSGALTAQAVAAQFFQSGFNSSTLAGLSAMMVSMMLIASSIFPSSR